MRDDQLPLTLSVLDRLLDSSEAVSDGRRVAPCCEGVATPSIDDMTRAVREHIEERLSRYRLAPTWPDNIADIDGTLMTFGVPSALAAALTTPEARRAVLDGVEQALRTGPLRLPHLSVALADSPDAPDSGILHLRLHTPSRRHTLNDLKAAIRRDLEDLLNTYRRATGWPKALKELDDSILAYGVPDMLAENLATVDARRRLVAELENTIRQWEPRFTSLSVVMLDNTDPNDRSLRFRISAEINADPALEPVIFDSVVDPTSNTVLVMRNARG